MAIVSKNIKVGIDGVINFFQEKTFPELIGFWGGDSAIYTSYPRANKNFKKDKEDDTVNLIPEISLDQKDYKDVLYSDKVGVNSFWLVDNVRNDGFDSGQTIATIHIIFQADLFKLYGLTDRADEKFDTEVQAVFRKDWKYKISDLAITDGIDAVYSDLTLSGDLKEKINWSDISERHVVKYTFDVRYDPSCEVTVTKTCADATILVYSEFLASVLSGGTLDIEVVDLVGDPVATAIVNGKIVVDCQPSGGTNFELLSGANFDLLNGDNFELLN